MNSYCAQPSRLQPTAVSLSRRYADVKTIAQAFALQEAPLAKTNGDVRGSIILHLSALSRFLNLRTALTDEHMEFIAEKVMSDENYKWLKPADLKIFFDRIKMGRYGDFYGNLNSISFFQSLDKYMIERNQEIERMRVQEQKEQAENFRQSTVLPYFINAEGRIEYTAAKKASLERERKCEEELQAETGRKRAVAEKMMSEIAKQNNQ